MTTTMVDNQHETTRTFLASPAAAGLARDLVDRHARAWGMNGLRNDLVTVVAELVGNAVEASRSDDVIKVAIRRDQSGVLIEVWDSSNEQPKLRKVELTLDLIDALPEDHQFGGWGLPIVEQLCTYSGVKWTPPCGKWIWGRFTTPKQAGSHS